MPLAIAAATTLCTIIVHALALVTIISGFRYEVGRGRAGVKFLIDATIVSGFTFVTITAHILEIAIWALVLIWCGEFTHFSAAFYHSAGNYTSLGSDVLMTPSWRMLGPLETADGMLMFGLSTAMIFAVILRFIQTRFADEITQARTSKRKTTA